MKTIFITSFHVLISRNILAAPLLGELLNQGNVRAVLLVPERKRQFFEQEFGRPGVIIEGVPRMLNRRDAFLRYLALASLNTKSLAIKRRTEMRGMGSWLVKFIGNRPRARSIIRRLDNWLTPRERFGSLLDRYQPRLIFSTDVQNENDIRFIREAKDRGITVAGMVRSWDNLTAKGLIRAIPDILIVNNEIIKREAVELHGIPESRIRVVGIPHYDRYTGPAHSREEFSRQAGLDPAKPFVLYAPTGDRYLAENQVDQEIIKIIAPSLPASHQLLVRLPPADSVNLKDFSTPANVFFDRPGRQLARDPNLFRLNELTREDDDHLRDTLAFCDLVIAGPSTIIIDAAVFDKPVILIGFDGAKTTPYYQSIRRYYDYDHFQPVLKNRGVRLAKSVGELKEWLAKYIKEPALDQAGRAKIREEQCLKLDGQSSQRLAETLLSFLA
mgnify:CR=1 FL=1